MEGSDPRPADLAYYKKIPYLLDGLDHEEIGNFIVVGEIGRAHV